MSFTKKFNKNKGITLIALVVTIIVLLILAGISISMLTGQNSILNRAADAREKSVLANAKEEVQVALSGYLIEKKTNSNTNANAKKYLEDNLDKSKLSDVVETGDIITCTYKGEKLRVDLSTGKTEYDNKISTWNGISSSEGLSGKGTKEEPYLIKSADDLQYMNKQIASSSNIKGLNDDETENSENVVSNNACYRLETNVKLNDTTNFEKWKEDGFDKSTLKKWTTIGWTSSTPISFFGIFDGNGYAIDGMYANQNYDCGFIAALYGKDALVQNLKITNSLVIGGSECGGIVGYASNGASIKDCYFSGSIISSSSMVGGIVGGISVTNAKAQISGCTNAGEIKGDFYVGGIVGSNHGANISNCENTGKIIASQKMAGIVGSEEKGEITYCKNNGEIMGIEETVAYAYTAGIVGEMIDCNIDKCVNNGNIIFVKLANTFYQIGGLVGMVSIRSADGISITNSINNGNITAGNSADLGQIIGAIYSSNGKKVTLSNVVNNGMVKFENGESAKIVGNDENYELK